MDVRRMTAGLRSVKWRDETLGAGEKCQCMGKMVVLGRSEDEVTWNQDVIQGWLPQETHPWADVRVSSRTWVVPRALG